jgi:uncharacterized membrane protein (DUF2068 family)
MQSTMEAARQRPLGVTIMAIVLGIQGLIELIGGILLLIGTHTITQKLIQHGHTIISKVVDVFGIGFGVVGVIVGLITLFFASGLWTLKRWAFWSVVIIEGFSVLVGIVELIRHTGSTAGVIASMILPVIILLYFLVDPNVRRAFRI